MTSNASMASPRFGQLARNTRSPAAAKSRTVRLHETPLNAMRMPSGIASSASLRRSRMIASASALGVRRRRRLDHQQAPADPGAERRASTSRRRACTRGAGRSRPSKSRSASSPVTRRPLSRTARTPAVGAARMADDVGRRDHHLREAGRARGGEPAFQRARERRGVDADVAVVHAPAASAAGSAWTSSNITPPSTGLVSAPRSLDVHLLGRQELDAALLQLGDGGE